MNETQATHFDKEAVYDEQISPLMTQIIAICKEHGIPHIAAFFIGGDDGDMLCTTINTTLDHTPDVLCDAVKALFPPRPSFMAMTIRKAE